MLPHADGLLFQLRGFAIYMLLRPTLSILDKISQAIRIISEFKIIRVICD